MTLYMPSTPGFVSSKFGLETNTMRFESPLTKTVQRLLLGGARWTLTFTLPKMQRDKAALWQAFLLACEGGANTFYGFDPDAKAPRGAATGAPVVSGGSQTGSTLTITGCTPDITGWLKAGDYFTVNSELKMLTADAATDGSGNTTLSFKPALRNSPLDGAAITVQNPTCIMALVDDMQAMWNANQNGIYDGMSISAVEVFS